MSRWNVSRKSRSSAPRVGERLLIEVLLSACGGGSARSHCIRSHTFSVVRLQPSCDAWSSALATGTISVRNLTVLAPITPKSCLWSHISTGPCPACLSRETAPGFYFIKFSLFGNSLQLASQPVRSFCLISETHASACGGPSPAQ